MIKVFIVECTECGTYASIFTETFQVEPDQYCFECDKITEHVLKKIKPQ